MNNISRLFITVGIILLIFIIEKSFNHPLDRTLNYILLEPINKNFSKDLVGNICYTIGNKKIYSVHYYYDVNSVAYKKISLKKIVNINSWREIKNSGINVRSFSDNNNFYDLYFLEDTFFRVYPK